VSIEIVVYNFWCKHGEWSVLGIPSLRGQATAELGTRKSH
jgi:hypothetical protein